MNDPLVNLNTVWDTAIENSEVFNQDDLIEILIAHLGSDLTKLLRTDNEDTRPCYAFIPCKECNYYKFCLVKHKSLITRGTKECQKTLKNFVSNFH